MRIKYKSRRYPRSLIQLQLLKEKKKNHGANVPHPNQSNTFLAKGNLTGVFLKVRNNSPIVRLRNKKSLSRLVLLCRRRFFLSLECVWRGHAQERKEITPRFN